jgi:hypothetical protein
MTIELGLEPLSREQLLAVARGLEPLSISDDVRARL